MREPGSSIGLQAVVGAIARMGVAEFDVQRTLQTLAEIAQAYSGARGVVLEEVVEGSEPQASLTVGEISGKARRLPIISEGKQLGFLALYGVSLFGPATADRTQVVADLAGIALTRAARGDRLIDPTVDDARYRLVTGVGHNLRNTLGAASGYMQLVEMEGTLAPREHEYVMRSRRAINAAVALISDLLELTRADAGKLSFDREPVNVNSLVSEAARMHTDAAAAKRCTLDIVPSKDDPVVLTDPSYVRQIVDVLIYNAVRYTPAQGAVTVTVDMREGRRSSDPPHWVCVSVKDTGEGVAEGEKVFEEVHRVEQTRGNVRFKLAICRRVARLLGGDVKLETEVNVGSTFTFWLPSHSTR